MKRLAVVAGLCILSVAGWTEDKKPSSVDLMIPPVVIEIERADKEDLSIVIPDYNDLKLPDLGIHLPAPADITIQKLPSDIPLPSLETPLQKKKAPFFTEGTIGAGLDSELTGNIRLFTVGTESQFSLLFSHSSLDGYGFRKTGEGYSRRKELFEGSLYGGTNSFSYTGQGALQETEDGLQKHSLLYTSVVHRFRSLSLEMNGKGTGPWSWELNGKVKSGQKVLSGSVPLLYNTLAARGRGTVSFAAGAAAVSLAGSYDLETGTDNTPPAQLLELGIDARYHFTAFDTGIYAAGGYLPGRGFVYPFSLYAQGTAGKIVQFRFEGGRKVLLSDNYDLWKNFAFAGNISGWTESWYAEGHVSSQVFPEFGIHADAGWEKSRGASTAPDITSLSSVTGLFPYSSTEERESLSVAGGCVYDINPALQFRADWKGQLMKDTDPLRPVQSVSAGLDYKTPDDFFKGSGAVTWDFIPLTLPEAGGNISFRISRGIFLTAQAEDLLPLFFQKDRIAAGPYSRPSGTITLSIKISL